jgi:hypothetical protein
VDIVCPLFEHTITSSTRPDGTPLTYEYIEYSGQTYNHVGDQWILNAGTQAQNHANASRTVPIIECTTGPVGADLTSLPYAAMLDGSVRRGEYRTVEDGACRDYNVTVSTPHDPVENEFQFSICINEEDHLPRETRHTLQGASQETVSRYSKYRRFLLTSRIEPSPSGDNSAAGTPQLGFRFGSMGCAARSASPQRRKIVAHRQESSKQKLQSDLNHPRAYIRLDLPERRASLLRPCPPRNS